MLPYALAIIVGLSSSVLFLTAFFLRDIHRQDDFFWSGVGLFYALVLWFCATSITGAVLLGQLAVVALLTAYFWQVIKLRKAIANPEKQSNLDSFSVVGFVKNLFKRSSPAVSPVEESKNESLTPETEQAPQKSTPPTIATSQVTPENPPSLKAVSSEDENKIAENSADRDRQDSLSEQTPSSVTTESKETVETEEKTTSEDTEDTSEISLETTVKKVVTAEEITTSVAEADKSENTEIAIETVTIVEEETNWDDEVEDLPASSVKVIQEEVATSPEPESQSSTIDTPSQEQKPDTKSESPDNPQS